VAAIRGAFLKYDAGLLGFAPNLVVFQFNPDSVTRSPALVFIPPESHGEGQKEIGAQPGEPSEGISFSLRLDATDQLASGDEVTAASGIMPALSALELLLYPKSSLTIDLFGGGSKPALHPPEKLGAVLFFWGQYRVMPVQVTSLSITETEYDELLTPIRAEVSVNLQVLTPRQLGDSAPLLKGAYKYTQGVKEVMAAINLLGTPDVITKVLTSF
jgi:hypothetical protein